MEEGGEYEEGEEFEEGEEGEEEGEEEEEAASAASARPPPPPAGPLMYESGRFVELGVIATAFGIRGEVKVVPSTDDPRARFTGRRRPTVYLQDPTPGAGSRPMPPVLIETARPIKQVESGELWALKLAGVPDRTRAEQLRRFKACGAESAQPCPRPHTPAFTPLPLAIEPSLCISRICFSCP